MPGHAPQHRIRRIAVPLPDPPVLAGQTPPPSRRVLPMNRGTPKTDTPRQPHPALITANSPQRRPQLRQPPPPSVHTIGRQPHPAYPSAPNQSGAIPKQTPKRISLPRTRASPSNTTTASTVTPSSGRAGHTHSHRPARTVREQAPPPPPLTLSNRGRWPCPPVP